MQETKEFYDKVMGDEVVNKIFKTWEYDRFTFFNGNRDIKPHHKNKLAESFKIKQLPIPIVVDESFRIADGQQVRGLQRFRTSGLLHRDYKHRDGRCSESE